MEVAPESGVVGGAYEAYRFELLGHLRAMTRDSELAEDLLHESYVRLITEVRAGRAPLNARAWLYTVATNLARSRRRRQRVAERRRDELPRPGSVRSAEDLYVEVEAWRVVGARLATMDATDRICFQMASEGYRSVDIARALASTPNAVRTRMCRARKRLRAETAVPVGTGGARPVRSLS